MKKNSIPKLELVFLLLLTGMCPQAHATDDGRNASPQKTYAVDLTLGSATVLTFTEAVTSQTGVLFSYESALSQMPLGDVSVHETAAPLEHILEKVFKGRGFRYKVVDRIVAAQNYLAAYANVRQLSFGMTDMAWHTLTEPFEGDVEQFEAVSMAPTQVLPVVSGTAMAPAFGHIFSGGYAAGYYGYKWAEVLEADAFSLFKEKGIFNREAASSFRENVLSKGGTEHPMELYVRFRGHKPETRALIEKMGLGK